MPYCYYTCNLLPLDLVARGGYSPRWLGNYLRDPNAPARREALSVHPMTCPYVTKLVAAAEEVLGGSAAGGGRPGDAAGSGTTGAWAAGGAPSDASADDCLVVPGGCDAMRRLGDLLAATYPGRVFVLSLPRSSGSAVAETLAADLRRLDDWLRQRLPGGAAGAQAADAGTRRALAGAPINAGSPTVDYPVAPRPGGVFLVAGPLSDDFLLRLIDKLGAHVSGLESCTSPDRWKPLAAVGSTVGSGVAGPDAAGGGPGVATAGAPGAAAHAGDKTGAPGYHALAAEMLAIGMCPRRSTADRRVYLTRRLDEARPSSIIYARQSFCDPGAYDALLVSQLANERRLPYLEIEVDFPFDAGGPLHTRVEAFLEAQLLDDALLDSYIFDGAGPADDLFDGDHDHLSTEEG